MSWIIHTVDPSEVSYASQALVEPLQPVSPECSSDQPTRHDIHEKRRYRRSNRSSTSLTLSGVDIQLNYPFLEEDFRAGGPELCNLPAKSVPYAADTDEHVFLDAEMLANIESVAKSHSLNVVEITFTGRRCIYEKKAPLLTLLIIAHRGDPLGRTWAAAAEGIYDKVLQWRMNVEIVDQDKLKPSNIFPCLESDRIFPLWRDVAIQILEKIDNNDIISLGCHRMGKPSSRQDRTPTILLSVRRHSTRQWDGVREKIIDVLNGFELQQTAVVIKESVLWKSCTAEN